MKKKKMVTDGILDAVATVFYEAQGEPVDVVAISKGLGFGRNTINNILVHNDNFLTIRTKGKVYVGEHKDKQSILKEIMEARRLCLEDHARRNEETRGQQDEEAKAPLRVVTLPTAERSEKQDHTRLLVEANAKLDAIIEFLCQSCNCSQENVEHAPE
jgi:hypothetical protein